MKKLFYPLAVITLLASILIIAGIQTNAVESIDQFGAKAFGNQTFLSFFGFLGAEVFLGTISILTVLFLWFRRNNYIGMVIVLLAVAGGNVLNKGIKSWVERERPVMGFSEHSYSFPSGHAMVSIVAAVVIIFLLTEQVAQHSTTILLFCAGIILSILTGLSRISDGAHYLSDVAGGWLIGYTYAILCLLLYEWLLKRRSLRPEKE